MSIIGIPMYTARVTISSHTPASAKLNSISGTVISSIHPGTSIEAPNAVWIRFMASSTNMTDPNSSVSQNRGVFTTSLRCSSVFSNLNTHLDWYSSNPTLASTDANMNIQNTDSPAPDRVHILVTIGARMNMLNGLSERKSKTSPTPHTIAATSMISMIRMTGMVTIVTVSDTCFRPFGFPEDTGLSDAPQCPQNAAPDDLYDSHSSHPSFSPQNLQNL